MSVLRWYGRASTDHQVLSTPQQESAGLTAFERRRSIEPNWRDVQWGGFFADEATCRETVFRERHAGSLILAASQPGDIIGVTAFERMLIGVVDAVETINYINEHRLRLWILDFGGMELDTTNAMGETFLVIMAQFKRIELLDIRRRTKDSIAYRQKVGRPHGHPPIGWAHKLVMVPGVPGPQRFIVANNADRRRARELLGIKNSRKLSVEQARQLCNAMGLKQKNGRPWTGPTFSAWCRSAERDFPLPNGSHTPAPIPADARPYVIETISEAD